MPTLSLNQPSFALNATKSTKDDGYSVFGVIRCEQTMEVPKDMDTAHAFDWVAHVVKNDKRGKKWNVLVLNAHGYYRDYNNNNLLELQEGGFGVHLGAPGIYSVNVESLFNKVSGLFVDIMLVACGVAYTCTDSCPPETLLRGKDLCKKIAVTAKANVYAAIGFHQNDGDSPQNAVHIGGDWIRFDQQGVPMLRTFDNGAPTWK